MYYSEQRRINTSHIKLVVVPRPAELHKWPFTISKIIVIFLDAYIVTREYLASRSVNLSHFLNY